MISSSSDPFWSGRRVLVTGGSGFLGRWLIPALERRGAVVFAPSSSELDLRQLEPVRRCFVELRPDLVFHLAAVQGGVAFINDRPADIYFQNLMMTTQVIDACRAAGVRRVLCMGSSCSYPDLHDRDLVEEDVWAGPMHPSVAHYGITKKVALLQLEAYRRQHRLEGTVVVPASLIGPGDDFSPERSHVAGALIRKFVEAVVRGEPAVSLWGTGRAVREFLYVKDCVEALTRIAELEKPVDMINVGSEAGVSIRELAELIQRISGFTGALVWDPTKPEGAPHKVVSTARARRLLGWTPQTSLEEGLRRTIAWYREQVGAGGAGS